MCGIHVHLGVNLNLESAKQALTTTLHRGPDGTQSIVEEVGNRKVFLGFNRLAINDLDITGMQPMSSKDGRFSLLFNGEIFNFSELRCELVKKNYSFRSSGDSEVLLYSYAEWGKDVVRKLDGQYAFVILDRLKKELFACRDPFGEKPLYYYLDSRGQLVISSSKKSVSLSLGIKPKIDVEFLRDTLSGIYPYSREETLIENVRQLKAGHYFLYDFPSSSLRIFQYFNYEKTEESTSRYEPNGQHKVDAGLIQSLVESTESRLPREVPFTLLLSGGVDSTSLATIIKKESHFFSPKLDSVFILGFKDSKDINEIPKARKIAKILGIHLNEIEIKPQSIVNQLNLMHYHYEELIPGTSILLEWELIRLVKEFGYKVALTGQGADELFGGYSYIAPYYLAASTNLRELVKRFNSIRSWRRRKNATSEEMVGNVGLLKNLLSVNRSLDRYREQNFREKPTILKDPLSDFLKLDISTFSLPRNLYFGDINGMAHGVELRNPFLSRSMVQQSQKFNLNDYFQNGYQKLFLRKYLERHLGSEIAYDVRKIGFEAPSNWLMQVDFKEWILERVHSMHLNTLFEPSEININAKVRMYNENPNRISNLMWEMASSIELMEIFN